MHFFQTILHPHDFNEENHMGCSSLADGSKITKGWKL